MDDLLYNGDKIAGQFSVVNKIPPRGDLVFYTYAGADLVSGQDLTFNLGPGYELVVLEGQRDQYGAVLRTLKHCVRYGQPLDYHNSMIYPVAVGYVENRPNDDPEHGVLVLVATREIEPDGHD